MKSEAIVLVPGLFGFAKIGKIEYFDKITPLLAASSGITERSIFAFDTLPTSSLWRRVALLYEEIERRRRDGYSTIHLVGHSTGGVDVRLLTNDAYSWPGAPPLKERAAQLAAIGRIVSISAPQKGTPIANRLRGTMENAVPFLFLLSILAKRPEKKNTIETLVRPLTMAYAAIQKGIFPWAHIDAVLKLSGFSYETAKEANAFLSKIVIDHPLIHELTIEGMAAINKRLVGGHQLPLVNFVTVAPKPWPLVARLALGKPWLLTPLQRGVYAFSYENARPEKSPFPTSTWVGGGCEPPGIDRDVAQDGVVPSASQTMDGVVQRFVYADHLDVVGHYEGTHGGETAFDSGADFDDARMKALWLEIGQSIQTYARPPRPQTNGPLIASRDATP